MQVRMLTADSTLPATVTIDVEADTPMEKVKMQLFRATGLPIQLQHVMLGGIGGSQLGAISNERGLGRQLMAICAHCTWRS